MSVRSLHSASIIARLPTEFEESGMAILCVTVVILVVTLLCVALIDLSSIDMYRASLHGAGAQGFYVAQSGLQRAIEFARANPHSSTPIKGVRGSVDGDDYTFWVDAGPVAPLTGACGAGLRGVEAVGSVTFLSRRFYSRVRACGASSMVDFALFGAGMVEFDRGRGYIARYDPPDAPCVPGGGGSIASTTEIRISSQAELNALGQSVVLRNQSAVPDYSLFCFSSMPEEGWTKDLNSSVLGAFGPLVKGRAWNAPMQNRCGTRFACLTVADRIIDTANIARLRGNLRNSHGVFASRIVEAVIQPVTPCEPQFGDFCPKTFAMQARKNNGNTVLNRSAASSTTPPDLSLMASQDSFYTARQFNEVLRYLATAQRGVGARRPGSMLSPFLRGVVFVDGTVSINTDADLGGPNGDLTLVIAGDLIVTATARNFHDVTTSGGRTRGGVLVFGGSTQGYSVPVCGGDVYVDGSGRFVLCGGRWEGDGLIYTQSGLIIRSNALVDQIGAVYNNSNGSGVSFTLRDGTFVLRYDPLALTALGDGFTPLSWQQLK